VRKAFSRGQLLAGAVTIVVTGTIAAGIFVLGSPAEERRRRLDERRIENLSEIAQAVDLYWTRHGRLPSSLEELRREPGATIADTDPVTHRAYEYRPATDRYELCAAFDRASDRSSPYRGAFWSHGAGRQCFQREVQKVR
jgi:hypothetical protein